MQLPRWLAATNSRPSGCGISAMPQPACSKSRAGRSKAKMCRAVAFSMPFSSFFHAFEPFAAWDRGQNSSMLALGSRNSGRNRSCCPPWVLFSISSLAVALTSRPGNSKISLWGLVRPLKPSKTLGLPGFSRAFARSGEPTRCSKLIL